jgi:transposase
MQHEKRFYRRSRIPESQFRALVLLFARDVSATEAATLVGLTRKSVTTIFLKLRRRMAEECERLSPVTASRIRQDTSLASARCVCGRCRPGVSFASPVFGVLAAQGKVFTQEIPDCRKPILRAIVRHRLDPAHVPIDGWHGYDALVEAESPQPFRVTNDHTGGSKGTQNIQSFWSFARQRLQKFNGVPNRTFYLHLKESEWRFNFSNSDVVSTAMTQAPSPPMCVGAQTAGADGMYCELLRLIERNPL